MAAEATCVHELPDGRRCSRPFVKTRRRQHRCPEHQRQANRASYQKSKAQGHFTRGWKQLRLQRLAVDGHRCQLRRPGCTVVATTVHLDPSLRGEHRLATLENTLSACRRCHGSVDAPRAKPKVTFMATEESESYEDDAKAGIFWGPPDSRGGSPRRWSRPWFEWR